MFVTSPLLSDERLPVCRRGEAAEAGMPSLPIVKHFNIIADVRSRLLPSTILPMSRNLSYLSPALFRVLILGRDEELLETLQSKNLDDALICPGSGDI
jgi:hypothetical protein